MSSSSKSTGGLRDLERQLEGFSRDARKDYSSSNKSPGGLRDLERQLEGFTLDAQKNYSSSSGSSEGVMTKLKAADLNHLEALGTVGYIITKKSKDNTEAVTDAMKMAQAGARLGSLFGQQGMWIGGAVGGAVGGLKGLYHKAVGDNGKDEEKEGTDEHCYESSVLLKGQ